MSKTLLGFQRYWTHFKTPSCLTAARWSILLLPSNWGQLKVHARTNRTHDCMLWQLIGVQEHLEWHWLRDGQLPSWWNPSTGVASPCKNFFKYFLTNIATTFHFEILNLVRCCRLELLGWAWCSLSLCDFTWVPRMKDLQQGTITCASLLAELGGSGEFERKFVKNWGNYRKIENFERK